MTWIDWTALYSAAAGTAALVLAIIDYRRSEHIEIVTRDVTSDLCSQCRRIEAIYRDELHSRN